MPKKSEEDVSLKYSECLEFLESLLQENCGDAKIGLADFSNNIENGWTLYCQRYLNAISEYREKENNKKI